MARWNELRTDFRPHRPGGRFVGENERGDMTGVRVTSPLVVIALGSRLAGPETTRALFSGYRGDRA